MLVEVQPRRFTNTWRIRVFAPHYQYALVNSFFMGSEQQAWFEAYICLHTVLSIFEEDPKQATVIVDDECQVHSLNYRALNLLGHLCRESLRNYVDVQSQIDFEDFWLRLQVDDCGERNLHLICHQVVREIRVEANKLPIPRKAGNRKLFCMRFSHPNLLINPEILYRMI